MASAPSADGAAFRHDEVVAEARALAQRGYAAPPLAPDSLRDLPYEVFNQIRVNPSWEAPPKSVGPFRIEVLPTGYLFHHQVNVFIITGGQASQVAPTSGHFSAPTPELEQALSAASGFSGFRALIPLNRRDQMDEFLVFQGGSYFRAISAGQIFGLSARGLAVDVAEPTGEELPIFRSIWIEPPDDKRPALTVHALLDGPSVSGAFRFEIEPGAPTTCAISAVLFPRRDLRHVGLGALTSMYMFGPRDGPDVPDYRPAVHDSDGLAIATHNGEQVWRALENPKSLQISSFQANHVLGFGLLQRKRSFEDFHDEGSRYERRPSAWIRPRGDWGEGVVTLVEIPSDSETNDNIVAYFRPKAPLLKGGEFSFSYLLSWPDLKTPGPSWAYVVRTGYGIDEITKQPQYVIDYEAHVPIEIDRLEVEAEVSGASTTSVGIASLPDPSRFRVILTFTPEEVELAEARVVPKVGGTPIGETWLSRWLRP